MRLVLLTLILACTAISLGIYLFSLLMFLTGAFFAFAAPYVLL